MGTSTYNRGQKGGTPLVPSWLDQLDTSPQMKMNLVLIVAKFHQ